MKINPFSLEKRSEALSICEDAARVTQDAAALADLIATARRLSPTAAAALDWAEQHGVIFAIDHQCRARGYYLTSTGIVSLHIRTALEKDRAAAIGTLVHEIRHAWQDYNGIFINFNQPVIDSVRDLALCEADAYALQTRAAAEAGLALYSHSK